MMDRNANAAENVLVDLDQELEHIRGFICGCRCFDGKLLTPRTNAKEITDRLRVSCTSSIDFFAVIAGSASLIVRLSSLTMTCHDSHKPVVFLLVREYQCDW